MARSPKLLPYPCPICGGKFGTAQIVVFNGVLRHSTKHPDFAHELKDYVYHRMRFLDSIRNGDGWLHGCYKNNLMFRIYHYSSENYYEIKNKMERKWWKKYPREIKKAYGREIHSFRTHYKINRDFYYGSDAREYSILAQDIFLAPDLFHLKRNQRSKSWSLNEKIANEKQGWLKELYEMIQQDGWYYKERVPSLMTQLRNS
jgi:hypothetical protein